MKNQYHGFNVYKGVKPQGLGPASYMAYYDLILGR